MAAIISILISAATLLGAGIGVVLLTGCGDVVETDAERFSR